METDSSRLTQLQQAFLDGLLVYPAAQVQQFLYQRVCREFFDVAQTVYPTHARKNDRKQYLCCAEHRRTSLCGWKQSVYQTAYFVKPGVIAHGSLYRSVQAQAFFGELFFYFSYAEWYFFTTFVLHALGEFLLVF